MDTATRQTPPHQPSLVSWLGYLALTFLVALPLAVLTVRSGAWQQGLLVYAVSCLAAAILLVAALVMLLLPRYASWRRAVAARALLTLPGTLLFLSILGGGDYPPIHDITTDPDDTLVFSAAEQQRGPNANSLDTDPDTLRQQRESYPDLQTLASSTAFDAVFDAALQVAADMGWDVYLQDRNAGIIEAVATTAIMGFRDDVIIRVRTNADGSLVDIRSVSRVGVSDMGANAARIRAFQQALRERGI
ncbi:MAG: DUF1499 domain-containing protein [Pseudomonadales bacterium]|nr:DUF1499 domain-containing protein [Pseudomonadales bacterium]